MDNNSMDINTFMLTLVCYVFIYTRLNRMMLRQMRIEDSEIIQEITTGMTREFSKSLAIVKLLHNMDLPKKEYTLQLKIYFITSRLMLVLFPVFAAAVWIFWGG